MLARLAQALGLKGKDRAADPKPAEDGKKPAPRAGRRRRSTATSSPRTSPRSKRDTYCSRRRAREAALDEEMALHCAA